MQVHTRDTRRHIMSNSIYNVDLESLDIDKLNCLQKIFEVLFKLGLESAYSVIELTEDVLVERVFM